jgi:hypothetical protein
VPCFAEDFQGRDTVKLYRMMKSDNGLPKIGSSYGHLGVRVPGRGTSRTFDISPDASGIVQTGTDGLSTFDSPAGFRNDPKFEIFSIESEELLSDLVVVPSVDTLGRFHLVPARSMTVDQYQEALAGTQDLWQLEPRGS